jgi:hypothetical protein
VNVDSFSYTTLSQLYNSVVQIAGLCMKSSDTDIYVMV